MKAIDVRSKTADELDTLLLDLRKEALNLRFRRTSGQLDDTAQVRRVRRDIARVKTIMEEKRRAGAGS